MRGPNGASSDAASTAPSRRSAWLRRAAILAALFAAGLALRATLFRPKAVPVTVFRAASGRVEETVVSSRAGTVKSRHRSSLSPEVGGRVVDLPVRQGDRVRAGQLLMRIADGDYRAQIRLQESALEAARASEKETCRAFDLAKRDLVRNEQLARDRIISAQLLDQLRSERDVRGSACEAARARIRQAAAGLEVVRVNLEKTVMRAPFDGVVADVSTEVGEWITPSPPGLPIPPVLEILDTGAIYVEAPMDEVDVARVRTGMPVRVTMDAYPERSFPGRVTLVAPYVLDVQEQNRTFDIEVELADGSFARSLRPGSSADVEVILAARDGVLRVPTYALIEGNRVLALKDGALADVRVETGLKNWAFTEITRGLGPGDEVVVSLDRAEVKAGARARAAGFATK
jgi:HlyD family secretion protein